MATQRQMIAGQRRTLKAMQKKIFEMSALWGDIDEFNMNNLAELSVKIGEASECLYSDENEDKDN